MHGNLEIISQAMRREKKKSNSNTLRKELNIIYFKG